VVAANCAGGTRGTNAGRRAVLVTTDQMTGQTAYLERRVEDILRNSTSNVDNPFLMANDAVICYDSRFVQFRDIMQSLSQFVFPIPLIRGFLP
jgi:polysaccharide export outer membrane protein